MSEFDAERYLRLLGERLVSRPVPQEARHGSSEIHAAAEALAVIDAVAPGTAEGIVREYELALALRGHGQLFGFVRGWGDGDAGDPVALEPCRVAECNQPIAMSAGTMVVHAAIFGPSSTSLLVTEEQSDPSGGLWQTTAVLADDQGNAAPVGFSGGGSGERMRGELRCAIALSPATAWLALGGERIELREPTEPPDVRVDDVPPFTPAQRHLWRQLTYNRMGLHRVDPIEPVVRALVAAGALDEDDGELRAVRAVVNAINNRDRNDPDLPETWRSILSGAGFGARPHQTTEFGVVALGLLLPVLDGVSLRLDALVLDSGSLSLVVGASSGLLPSGALRARGETVTWWAEDDRGNTYLGQVMGYHSAAEGCEASVTFVGQLDEEATIIELRPTVATQRAVVHVPLDRLRGRAS